MTDHGFYDNTSGALLSDDRRYRYRLWRTWNDHEPAVAFIMLNPSTADAENDDNTVRRCRGYAEDWGFEELIVGNIFALGATDPDELYDHDAPVGPHNDAHLKDIAMDADLVVAAWGHHGELHERGRAVTMMLRGEGHELHALDTTQEGHPEHPLYQPRDTEPVPFDYVD